MLYWAMSNREGIKIPAQSNAVLDEAAHFNGRKTDFHPVRLTTLLVYKSHTVGLWVSLLG